MLDIAALPVYFTLIGAIALLYLTISFLRYFQKREQELEEKESKIDSRYKELLEHAHNRIRSILEKTVEKADKMLLETEYLNHHIKEDFSHTLDKVIETNQSLLSRNTEDFFQIYRKDLEKVKQDYNNEIKIILEEIKTSTQEELKDFMTIQLKETIDSQTYIGKQINDQFEKAQKEINAYKEKQMSKLDGSIDRMLLEVAEKVLGKTIPIKDHETLILEALTKAKEEGLFTQ